MNDEQETLVEEQILYFKVQSTLYVRVRTTIPKIDAEHINTLLKRRFEWPLFGYKNLMLATDGGTLTTTTLAKKPRGLFKELDSK